MLKAKLPTWKNNLIFFALICTLVMGYYLFQIHHARLVVNRHILGHANLVAEIVQHTAQGAVLSKELFDKLMTIFLLNMARFIAYLDNIEQFESDELSALSEEMGLFSIFIQRKNNEAISELSYLPFLKDVCSSNKGLSHDQNLHLYLYKYQESDLCISLAVSAKKIEELSTKTGLSHVMSHLRDVPGIKNVKLISSSLTKKITFSTTDNEKIATVVLPMENGTLEVVLEVTDLSAMITRLWRDFFIFGFGLGIIGLFLSYLIYRKQMEDIHQIRIFEDSLAKERQIAAIGKASATIAHEIRNPLNAISMGIQRLRLEKNRLDQEGEHFLDVINKEINRVNESVENLLTLAKPTSPRAKKIIFSKLVEDLFLLYENELRSRKIKHTVNIQDGRPFYLDPNQMAQLIENLIKNAIDAQPKGGFLELKVYQKSNIQYLSLKNGGFTLTVDESKQLLDPFFTTKRKGTGLGLYISSRIAKAHKGEIYLKFPQKGIIEVTVSLKDIVEDI